MLLALARIGGVLLDNLEGVAPYKEDSTGGLAPYTCVSGGKAYSTVGKRHVEYDIIVTVHGAIIEEFLSILDVQLAVDLGAARHRW